MSNQQVISYADLSIINNALRSLDSNVGRINSELGDISFKQDQLETDLEKLATAFADFVEADLKHKALQLAETRVGNLKQDLHIKFGYYAEIRRMATGILQGVDSGVISDDTLRFTTEEVLLKAPGYWLAPALVALSSWIRNDRQTCDVAINDSLKKDDYKSTLFFMLVMRRLGRNQASLLWLKRYFAHQDPHQLDREFITIMEAVTTGIFPPAARQLMMQYVRDWLEVLSQADEFVNEQKQQWLNYFIAAGPSPDDAYPLLKRFSPTYSKLEVSRRRSKTYQLLIDHFTGIVQTSADLSKAVKVQLDEILSLLVTNFDDEELPLQKQVRLNELIIELDGDKKIAQARMDAEEHIFKEQVDFLQLLTNAAFNPEQAGATKVTQVLAVSISQPWIVAAHDIFTAQNRNEVPEIIELTIDGFSTSTKDGRDEEELLSSQWNYYEQLFLTQLKDLKFPMFSLIIGIGLTLIGALKFINPASMELDPMMAVFAILIGVFLLGYAFVSHKNAKKKVRTKLDERAEKGREVLRGCIAEIVDFRNEYAADDAKAEKLRDLLESIIPEDFSSVSKETSRTLLTV